MALWLPRRFRGYGSAISGREPNLIVGYEMDPHEGTLVNKEVSGTGGGSDGTIYGACALRDPILGCGLRFNGSDAVEFTQTGDTHTAGTVAFSFCIYAVGGTQRFVYANAGASGLYYAAQLGANLVTRLGDIGSNQDTGIDPIVGKHYRMLVTWTSSHVYVYLDGEPVDDYASNFVQDIATMFIGAEDATGFRGLDGEMYDLLLARRTFTADDAKRDYQQSMATRAQFLEDFSGAFVSSADQGGAAGTPIENTAWKCADATGRFQIVDAAIPPNQNAKALKCTTAGAAYIENQWLGLKAADPEGAYGSVSFYLNKVAGSDSFVYFISDDTSGTNGYALYVSSTERVYIRKFTGGVPAALMRTVVGYVTAGTPHLYTITRRFDGLTTVLVDGVPIPAASVDSGSNPFTDNTHTDSSYILADLDADDECSHFSKRFGVAP